MDIKTALNSLDLKNDDNWTTDGLPRLDVVGKIIGRDVTRAEIKTNAISFCRSNPIFDDSQNVGGNAVGMAISDGVENNRLKSERITAELNEAKRQFSESQKTLLTAKNKMDTLIIEQVNENDRNFANDVKAYQKSQHEQRENIKAQANIMAEALRLAKSTTKN